MMRTGKASLRLVQCRQVVHKPIDKENDQQRESNQRRVLELAAGLKFIQSTSEFV